LLDVKAFLLAGGRGTRLQPLTETVPKCLVSIGGTPLLGIWLDLLDRHGVGDVLLNVSHHADQVDTYLASRSDGPAVRLVVEDRPYGNAGTVAREAAFVAGEESFWICYADNLTDVALDRMLAIHRAHDGVMTVGLFHTPNPSASGVVQRDARGRIVAFEEKPEHPTTDLANAGIYAARPALFEHIPTNAEIVDFGHDVLPRLVGRMYGHVIDQFLADVGTIGRLERASAAWRARSPELLRPEEHP